MGGRFPSQHERLVRVYLPVSLNEALTVRASSEYRSATGEVKAAVDAYLAGPTDGLASVEVDVEDRVERYFRLALEVHAELERRAEAQGLTVQRLLIAVIAGHLVGVR